MMISPVFSLPVKRKKSITTLLGFGSTAIKTNSELCSIHPQSSNFTGLFQRFAKFRRPDVVPTPPPSQTSIDQSVMVRDTTGSLELSDLWRKETIILKVIGSTQCSKCLKEARDLHDFLVSEDVENIKLVAVLQDPLDLKDYLQGGLWDWELVHDDNNVVASFLDVGSTRNTFNSYMSSFPSLNRAQSTIRDSTFVIAPGGRILSSFKDSFRPECLSVLF